MKEAGYFSIKLKHLIVVGCVIFSSNCALACSVARPVGIFIPDIETIGDDMLLEVPPPIVKIESVRRAKSSVVGSCDALARVNMTIMIPPKSPCKVSELGFVFRVISGGRVNPYIAFPDFPITLEDVRGGVAHFTIYLEDPKDGWKDDIIKDIDVFSISKSLKVSASVQVPLRVPRYVP